MKLALPFPRNLLTQGFAANANPLYSGQGLKGHSGEDYGVEWGAPIRSVTDAYVYAVRNNNHPDPTKYRAVYTLVNDGKDWVEVSYGHCSTMVAKIGKVHAGDILAHAGNTGAVYSGGKEVSRESRLRGSKAGTHLHFQVRALKRVTKATAGRKYLEDGGGLLKLDGYFFEIPKYDNGYNGCIDPAPLYLPTTAKEAAERRENLKTILSLLTTLVALLKSKFSKTV